MIHMNKVGPLNQRKILSVCQNDHACKLRNVSRMGTNREMSSPHNQSLLLARKLLKSSQIKPQVANWPKHSFRSAHQRPHTKKSRKTPTSLYAVEPSVDSSEGDEADLVHTTLPTLSRWMNFRDGWSSHNIQFRDIWQRHKQKRRDAHVGTKLKRQGARCTTKLEIFWQKKFDSGNG